MKPKATVHLPPMSMPIPLQPTIIHQAYIQCTHTKYNWLLQCTEYSHTLSKDVLSVYYRIQRADYRIQSAGFLMLL